MQQLSNYSLKTAVFDLDLSVLGLPLNLLRPAKPNCNSKRGSSKPKGNSKSSRSSKPSHKTVATAVTTTAATTVSIVITAAAITGQQAAHTDQSTACHGHLLNQQRASLDRKSTRLNSSHVAISYAVFCLKKKTSYHGTNSPT